MECTLCGAECESVVHVLWECTAYSSSRASFTEKLQELLGDSYANFDLLSNVEKTSYVLGSEHWEKNFKSLLFLVKEYIVDVWEVRKQILYGDDACPSHLQSQSSVGDLGGVTGVDGHRSGKLDKRGKSVHVNTCSIHFGTNSCVLVCVAPPMVVGAWSMAEALRQLFEYYYYYTLMACFCTKSGRLLCAFVSWRQFCR